MMFAVVWLGPPPFRGDARQRGGGCPLSSEP